MQNEDTPIPRYKIGETSSGPSAKKKTKKQPEEKKLKTPEAKAEIAPDSPLPGKINPSKLDNENPATTKIFIFAAKLGALLFVSFVVNVFLLNKISALELKMENNSTTVKAILQSKESLGEKKMMIDQELEQTKDSLIKYKSDISKLNDENKRTRAGLEKEEKKYALLEEELKNYGEQVKELAEKELSYYDAYTKKASELDDARSVATSLETKISQLKDDSEEIVDQLKETKAAHSYAMGVTYAQINMFDEAILNFEKFFSLYPNDSRAAYNMAYIYDTAKNNKEKAIKYYNKYLRLDPDATDKFEIENRIKALRRR